MKHTTIYNAKSEPGDIFRPWFLWGDGPDIWAAVQADNGENAIVCARCLHDELLGASASEPFELRREAETRPVLVWAGSEPRAALLDVDVQQIAELALPALERACRLLPRGELATITRELLEGATLVGPAGAVLLFGQQIGPNVVDTFDSAFRGRTIDTWRLLWFALRTHYPDLFGLLAARGGTAKATASPSAE